MGIDIDGWVEVREPNFTDREWNAVIRIWPIIIRDYDMFGSLFGVANHTELPPIAPVRGIPNDFSADALTTFEPSETIAQSWITWHEINTIDWSESALDLRPHQYKEAPTGELIYESKAEQWGKAKPPDDLHVVEGASWHIDGRLYRFESISRQAILDGAPRWKLLFDLMKQLAGTYGNDNVRLVVWFNE